MEPPVTPLSISHVLTAWRAAERELNAASAGSPERPALQARLERFRATYHRLSDVRRDRAHPDDDARMAADLRVYVTGQDRLSLVSR